MVFEPAIFKYLDADGDSLEARALEQLASEGQLAAYRHDDSCRYAASCPSLASCSKALASRLSPSASRYLNIAGSKTMNQPSIQSSPICGYSTTSGTRST